MKRTNKKLALHRETVRVLAGQALDQAAGGAPTTTAVTCGCTLVQCPQTRRCTTAPQCTLTCPTG